MRALLALALLAANPAPTPAAAPRAMPRAVAPGAAKQTQIPIPEDRIAAARKLLDELRHAIIHRDDAATAALFSGDDALSSVGRQMADWLGDRETKVRLVPLAPAGDGLYVRVVASRELLASQNDAPEMFAGPDAQGTWRFFPSGPRSAIDATLVASTARVRIDPKNGTTTGEATLTIANHGERWVAIELDLATLDPEDAAQDPYGFRLDEVSVPFEALAGANVLIAVLDSSAAQSTVSIAWHGPPAPMLNRITPGLVMLHEAQAWMPALPRTDADFDVTIEYPSDFEILAEGLAPPEKIDKKWRRVRTRVHADRGTSVFGAPEYDAKSIELGDVKVRLAVTPRRAARIPELETAIRATHDAMKILGPLPAKDLRIVESETPGNIKALGGRSFLALSPQGLDHTTVAHELAHSWFGGAVSTTYRGAWGGEWPETLAEYVVTWTLDDARARKERRKWSECYGPARGDDEGAVRDARKSTMQAQVLLYCKGPLLMAGLEARIGRDAMRTALASFTQRNAGKLASWEDVIASFDAPAQAWLRDRLARGRGPSITLEDLAVKDGTLHGTVVQRFGSWEPEVMTEELVLQPVDATGAPVGAPFTVSLAARRTPFETVLPAGARSLQVDPDVRLAWKYPSPDARLIALPK